MGHGRHQNEVVGRYEEVVRWERELAELDGSEAKNGSPEDRAERWDETSPDMRRRRHDTDVRRHDAWRGLEEACRAAERAGVAPETIAGWLGVTEPALKSMLEHRAVAS